MGKLFGLFVGINDYGGRANRLNGCVNDAKDLQKLFHCDKSGLLLDSQATKKNIVATMLLTLGWLQAGDAAIITFSGHGTWVPDKNGDEPDGRDECLCPYDLSEKNLLVDDEISAILAKRDPGSKVLFVTDSCHSGTVFRFADIDGSKIQQPRFVPPTTFLTGRSRKQAIALENGPITKVVKTAAPLPGVAHFSGCKNTEYSYDSYFNGRANGALTYHFTRAYKAGTTVNGLFAAIRKALPSQSQPQTPQLNATTAMKNWRLP